MNQITTNGTRPGVPKKWIAIGSVIAVVLLIVIFAVSTYNGCFSAEQNVDEKWGNVQTQYQRRKDLIPNLERAVKAYMEYEGKTMTNITEARTGQLKDLEAKKRAAEKAQKAADAADLPEGEAPATEEDIQYYADAQAKAQRALDIYVNAVHEAYPDLKTSQQFSDFNVVLEGTENRIQTARQDYNAAVKEYNLKRGRFPAVIFSGMLGFQKKPMYRADADASQAPETFQQ